ncbi:MAG: A24 family peptidase [Planctomycetota bacterium]
MTGAAQIYDVSIQVIFFLVLIVCAVTEVRENKIYNVVTYPTILLGLGLNFLWKGVPGIQISLFGFGVGFGVYFLFWMMKGIWPGDVKLGAAIGALKGYPFILDVILWAAIFGFIMAIFTVGIVATVAIVKGAAKEIRTIRTRKGGGEDAAKEPEKGMPRIPYGVAIALGAAVTFVCWLPKVNISWVR